MLNPFELKIHNQAEDEEITRIWRRHPITIVKPALRVIAFILIPIFLLILTGLSMFTSVWLFALYLIIIAVCFTYAAYEWLSWYGDVYVLTNYRIVDVEQDGFFHRKFSEAPIGRVEDISYDIKGFWQTMFNYGTVNVQTAGAVPNVSLEDVSNPPYFVKFLLDEQRKYMEAHGNESDSMSAEELIQLLAKHKDHLDEIAKKETEEKEGKRAEQYEKVKNAEEKAKKRGRKSVHHKDDNS